MQSSKKIKQGQVESSSGGGGSQNLQQVTTIGSTTNMPITVLPSIGTQLNSYNKTTVDGEKILFRTTYDDGSGFNFSPKDVVFKPDPTTALDITLTLPKLSGTLARVEDVATNLSWNPSTNTVESSTGLDAVITQANINFDGLMSKEDYKNINIVPSFADSAAAIAGGLAIGRRFRTGDFLKIVNDGF